MKKRFLLSRLASYGSVLLLILLIACNGYVSENERNTVPANVFTGVYQLESTLPLDSNNLSKAAMASDWKIILQENNYFQLNGTEKNINGYWKIDRNGEEYLILFHTGAITTVARFNGKEVYFDKPDMLLDSIFIKATFLKKEEKQAHGNLQ